MVIDDQDRILLTEYRGNKLALFDTKTEKVTEWPLPPLHLSLSCGRRQERRTVDRRDAHRPRGAARSQDRRDRRIPAADETNMRTVFIDNSTTPVTFWTGSNHGAALVKVEPLD